MTVQNDIAFTNVRIIQTAANTTDRLTEKDLVAFTPAGGHETMLVQLFPEVAYQEIEGFGGAFTEAVAVTLDHAGQTISKRVVDAYFHPQNGIGYSLCRTHINSCDFAVGNYDYLSRENDMDLATFSIAHDSKHLIPLIRHALATRGAPIRLLASPWSPPAWMKTNNCMNKGGSLKPEFREVWARYYVKYIEAYAAAGIPVWAITIQNEPKATQKWDSCVYTAEEERDFLRDYLGPSLQKSGHEDVNILVWDHNKERVFERGKTILGDADAASYAWGIAYHWYSGDHFENLDLAHQCFPGKKLLFTEGCQEGGVRMQSWAEAERYGHNYIGDLNHWSSGCIDWNMALDRQGGPNHVGNYCNAPIIVNVETKEIIFQPSYYYIGHLSKFILPGARRIGMSRFTDRLEVVAVRNPDTTIVTVVMNRTDEEIPFYLKCQDRMAKTVSKAHSMMTLVFNDDFDTSGR